MGIIWLVVLIEVVLLAGECALLVWGCKISERYINLEEWAEDWLKRLEQKHEANENHVAKCAAKIVELEDLLPKNGKNEVVRNQVLLSQLNDEMERSLNMEKEWNEGVAAILNYGKPKRGE